MSETVTIAFSVFGYERATIALPWQRGKRLKSYLRAPAVLKYELVKQALTNGAKDQYGRKIKLTTPVNPGSIVRVGGAW